MADSSRGTKKSVLKVKTGGGEEAEVELVPGTPKEETWSITPSKMHPKVQKTIDDADPGWTVKIKSKENFDAASAAIKASNPKGLKIVHKPGLGHHSIASR